MAKIPLYTESETYSGKPGEVFSLQGERSRAIVSPFAEDTRVESVASAINHIGDKMIEAEELDQYNRGLMGIKKGADAIVEEANTEWRNLGLKGHEAAFNERWRTLQEEVDSSIKSNNTKRALAVQFEATHLSAMAEVRGIAHKRVHDSLIAGSVSSKEELLDRAINAADADEMLDNITALKGVNAGLVAAGAITKEQAAVNDEKYEGMMNKGYLKRVLSDEVNNKFIIEDFLRIRTPKEVYEMLGMYTSFKNLNELEKDEMVRHAYTVYKSAGVLTRQQEADVERKRKKDLAEADFAAIRKYNDNKVKNPESVDRTWLNNLIDSKTRGISKEMYQKIANDMEQEDKTPTISTKDADVITVGNIAVDIAQGKDVSDRLDAALIADQISRATYISFKTKMADKEYQQGLKEINNTFKPLPFETMTPDSALKTRANHAEMVRKYNDFIEKEDMKPLEASLEVRKLAGVKKPKGTDKVQPLNVDVPLSPVNIKAKREKYKKLLREGATPDELKMIEENLEVMKIWEGK